MAIKDVPAATMYDVLHDNQYRKTWDLTMSESYDIARLSANADVGYYSCKDSLSALKVIYSCVCVCVRRDVHLACRWHRRAVRLRGKCKLRLHHFQLHFLGHGL